MVQEGGHGVGGWSWCRRVVIVQVGGHCAGGWSWRRWVAMVQGGHGTGGWPWCRWVVMVSYGRWVLKINLTTCTCTACVHCVAFRVRHMFSHMCNTDLFFALCYNNVYTFHHLHLKVTQVPSHPSAPSSALSDSYLLLNPSCDSSSYSCNELSASYLDAFLSAFLYHYWGTNQCLSQLHTTSTLL